MYNFSHHQVELYWTEKNAFKSFNSESFWKEYEIKLPRLFRLARKLLNNQYFLNNAPDLEIDTLEIPAGKILDLISWRGNIDNL